MKTPLKLVLLYLLTQLCVGAIVSLTVVFAPHIWHVNGIYLSKVLMTPSLLVSMGIMFLYLYKKHYLPTDASSWSFVSFSYTLGTLILGISAIILVDFISSFLYWIPDLMKSTFDLMSAGTIGIITLSVIGPVFEELLFRGAITRILLMHYKPLKAILFSALIFGIFHLNPAQIIPAILIGLIFATLYYRTRSLIPGILIHVINNSISTYSSIRYPEAESLREIMGSSIYIISVCFAFVLFLLSAYLMSRITNKRHPEFLSEQ